MKKIFGFILGIMFLVGCQEVAVMQDVILFTGTENTSKVNFTVEQPTEMGVTVTATDKVTKDTKVFISIGDQEQLNAYNRKEGRTYQFPPIGSYKLETNETIIKEGNYVSEAIKLSILSLEQFKDDAAYCIPLVITGTDGDMPILESSRVMYVVINRVLFQRALKLGGHCGLHVPQFMTDPRVSALGQITMETRVRVDAFHRADWGIASIMGIEETYLLRFCDIDVKQNQLQMGPALINGAEKNFITSESNYEVGRWYHIASVFDGSSVAIYVNGKLDVKFSVNPGTVNLNEDYFEGFWIGQSCGARYLDGTLCETRVWSRALTANEIQDKMCVVDPKSEGLLAYWRMNEVQDDGRILDVTGNGFDAFPKNTSYSFVDNVRCPF